MAQSVAVVRERRPGDRRIVAYVVATAGAVVDAAVVRERVAAMLPAYMVPSAVVVLDALPLTVNGKLDRAALPVPDYAVTAGSGRGPANAEEELLCEAFANVLGLSGSASDDDFFALGGHSLLATGWSAAIRAVPGRRGADPGGVRGTDAGRARRPGWRIRRSAEEARPALRADARPGERMIPLSFAQRRLWFLGQLEGPSATYNIPMALRLTGELDREALVEALRDVVGRHEVLRTVFPVADGEPFQRVLSLVECGFEVPVAEVTPQELDAAVAETVGSVFDLASEIPLRATVFAVAPEEHVLVVLVHHIASDGWSIRCAGAGRLHGVYRSAGGPEAGLGRVAGAVRGLCVVAAGGAR